MLRILPFITLFAATGVAADPPPPVPAKLVTLTKSAPLPELAAEITKQTSLPLDVAAVGSSTVSVAFDRTSFWSAVEKLADSTDSRITLDRHQVKLLKRANGTRPAPTAIDGPFRIAVKRVVAKRDFEAGTTEYEVQLEVLWEPRFPVYLIDAEPKVSKVTADGKVVSVEAPTGRVMPNGHSHTAIVRLKGVPRAAKQLDELTGTFALVAAERILAVEFKDLTSDKPALQTVDGVAVTLRPVKKLEKRLEFGFELGYPPSHPEFESFQLWTEGNRLKLIAPDNRTTYEPTDHSSDENGRRVRVDYNFTGPNGQAFALPDLKGWRVVYETPCPMTQQKVTFTLRGIDLP
jgi:hypothetical protein